MQNKNTYFIIFFGLLLAFKPVISQIPYETSKAALIFQFAKNISHESYKNIDVYKICFLGEDLKTFQELKKITKNNQINGKPVELYFTNDLQEISDIQLLYIDKTWAKNIEEVWFAIENKNILLISEQCNDAKYIMINIFRDEQKEIISYAVNKANIIIEGFIIDPELIISSENEIDIRELYREIRLDLENEKQEVERHKEIINKQKLELNTLHKQADSLNADIELLLEKIYVTGGKLNYLTDSITKQQKILQLKLEQIEGQEVKLENQKNEIARKENEIIDRKKELDSIIQEKNKQQIIIDEQKNTVSNQKNIISEKNRQLILFSALAFVLLILIILILYAYRIRKKAIKRQLESNKRLEKQKLILEKTLTKLTDTQSQLLHSEKMASLGILTAGIAHEINNPVNYINSGLEGLKTISTQLIDTISNYQKSENKDKSDKNNIENIKNELTYLSDGIQTLTKNIQTGVNRTTEIIKNLSTFSRIDDDNLTLTNIHENIDLTLKLLKNQIKNRISIIKNFDKIPKIYCYSGKINQVFMNIITNGVQAIKDKGTITISTKYLKESQEYKKECVKISIKDTGTGIPKDIKNKIFEPFFTTKKVGEGTGLGLSITHSIIEQHNGQLIVNSNNSGTEFIIYLPIINK